MRGAALVIAVFLTGCGAPAPQADMPARTWKYYVANPGEIEPMQKICRQWSGSDAPAASQPAVVTANCSAAGYAQARMKLKN